MSVASGSSSAKLAVIEPETERVFVWSVGQLHCLDPDNVSNPVLWASPLVLPTNEDAQTPAIGPSLEDPSKKLVYVTGFLGQSATPGSPERLFAFFADGNLQPGGIYAPLAWKAAINLHGDGDCEDLSEPQKCAGSLGSPAVHDSPNAAIDGCPVVGSDDFDLYGFYNSQTIIAPNNMRWSIPSSPAFYISSTPALSPMGEMLFWNESRTFMFVDHGLTVLNESRTESGGWVWGAPSVDESRRGFIVRLSGEIEAFRLYEEYPPGHPLQNRLVPQWSPAFYAPPTIGAHTLKRPTHGQIAVDLDGSLIVVNDGYVFSLRVPASAVSDFDLSGCVNTSDIDPFLVALLYPECWDQCWGIAAGANVVAIGDCNYDGLFNNFDIDCHVERFLSPTCTTTIPCTCNDGGESMLGSAGSASVDYFAERVLWAYSATNTPIPADILNMILTRCGDGESQ